MIDKDTKEILELAAYLVTLGEGIAKLGSYIAAREKEKRSRSSAKPAKPRKRRKRR